MVVFPCERKARLGVQADHIETSLLDNQELFGDGTVKKTICGYSNKGRASLFVRGACLLSFCNISTNLAIYGLWLSWS